MSTADHAALRNTIESIDATAQFGLTEISTLARLALACLRTGQNPHDVANALVSINARSLELQGLIESQASDVGCHSAGPAFRVSMQARPASVGA